MHPLLDVNTIHIEVYVLAVKPLISYEKLQINTSGLHNIT